VGITLIDCQQATSHLASLGARPLPRSDFERHVALTSGAAEPARWTYDAAHWAHLGLATATPSAP
jgi:leucyl/phenylalanyl-tRNA--protein transferase